MVQKDGFGIEEGVLRVTKARVEVKHYPRPEDFGDGFGVYRAIMTRLHGAIPPDLDYAMERFRTKIQMYAKSWQWQTVILQAAMAHQNSVMKTDHFNVAAWEITDTFLMEYCRPLSHQERHNGTKGWIWLGRGPYH